MQDRDSQVYAGTPSCRESYVSHYASAAGGNLGWLEGEGNNEGEWHTVVRESLKRGNSKARPSSDMRIVMENIVLIQDFPSELLSSEVVLSPFS
jgi:hypothetical protein